MAERRCPMCGKPNPEHLDVCKFCQARLTPLTTQSSQNNWEDESSGETHSNQNEPPQPGGDDDAQDWLNKFRSGAGTEDAPSLDTEPEAAIDKDELDSDGGDNWLQRIRALQQADQGNDFDSQFDEESPGDLDASSIFDSGNLDTDGNQAPDWVDRSNHERTSNDTGLSASSQPGEDELPDWLSSGREDGPPEPQIDTGDQDVFPVWLTSGFEPQEGGDQPDAGQDTTPHDQASSQGEDTFLDFLSSLEDEAAATPPEERKDLSQLPQAEPEIESTILDQDNETLDYFLDLDTGDLTSGDITAGPHEDLPDPFQEPKTADLEAETGFSLESPDEEIPDWLSSLGQDDDSYDFSTAGSAGDSPLDPISAFGAEESDEPPTLQRPGDETPDWLRELGTGKEAAEDQPGGVPPELDQVEEPAPEGDEAFRDWFDETDKSSEPEPVIADSGPDADEMPGWLKNLGAVVTGTIEDDTIFETETDDSTPFIGQDDFDDDLLDVESLPDWLTPESDSPEASETIDDSNLSPAELPGWLEAMRPVGDKETSSTPAADGSAESAGPLAGLHAVLPAEPGIARFKKPPVYSAKLRVTESQLAHADFLKNLLAVEGKPEPIPEPSLVSSQRALRWLTAFILTIVIGFVVIGGSQFVPLPDRGAIPDTTIAASKTISALPNEAPVLLAFDYEPGTAGEMHAAAAALVDHLMLKAARLTLVSTLPTGPALAEYFIQTVQSQHDYTSGTQYINLGYIPGGPTGLLSFAQIPQWIFPRSYEGLDPWTTQPLQDVNSISDFELVVIIIDDPDTARSWIEQVQPRMGDTPLLAVVSAQAEPLVRPYYGTGPGAQVRGMISGLSGGAAYEVTVGRANLGRTYWDAFSISLVIAVGAILIGGTVNVVKLVLARSKKEYKGEEEE